MTILSLVGQFIWYTLVSVNDALAHGRTVYWYTLVSVNILLVDGQFIIMVHLG